MGHVRFDDFGFLNDLIPSSTSDRSNRRKPITDTFGREFSAFNLNNKAQHASLSLLKLSNFGKFGRNASFDDFLGNVVFRAPENAPKGARGNALNVPFAKGSAGSFKVSNLAGSFRNEFADNTGEHSIQSNRDAAARKGAGFSVLRNTKIDDAFLSKISSSGGFTDVGENFLGQTIFRDNTTGFLSRERGLSAVGLGLGETKEPRVLAFKNRGRNRQSTVSGRRVGGTSGGTKSSSSILGSQSILG